MTTLPPGPLSLTDPLPSDRELATLWSAALRSGHYAQGQHRLRQSYPGLPTHCCLGVLCLTVGIAPELIEDRGTIRSVLSYHKSNLSDFEQRRLRTLDEFTARICSPVCGSDSSFILLNDEDKESFTQIADRLDQAIPNLNG